LAKPSRDHSSLTVHALTGNMKAVYAQAKIILMSSIVEEAWGRVAPEAQFSGVPVIESDRGARSTLRAGRSP
jgi:glycosyltransferase involved in cell wall biosynthesis